MNSFLKKKAEFRRKIAKEADSMSPYKLKDFLRKLQFRKQHLQI